MNTGRMMEALLGGGGRGAAGPRQGGGLDALLGGLGGGAPRGRMPDAGGPVASGGGMPGGGMPGGGMPGGGMPGGAMGGSLGDLLGSLARGGGGAAGAGGGLGGLLGGLLGGGAGAPRPGGGMSAGGMPGGLGGLLSGGVGGAAAGGLLGSILGGGGRSGGGGLVRVGGMALLGLLAHRAFEQWKAQQAQAGGGGATAPETPRPGDFARAEAPDAAGKPFGLSLVRAMVAAARADGVIDAAEHERIFAEAERLELDPAEKAEMFAILRTEADPDGIARLAGSDAQRAELYLASAMVIGAQNSAERVYLDALAHRLGLDRGLRATLDAQVREAAELEEQMGGRPG